MTRIFFMARRSVRPVRVVVERSIAKRSGRTVLTTHDSLRNLPGASPGMTPLHETLRTLLAGKATELFADYGVACALVDTATDTGRQLCGVLGFTGDRLCGSVVISATTEA